jgi:hypothetical protein
VPNTSGKAGGAAAWSLDLASALFGPCFEFEKVIQNNSVGDAMQIERLGEDSRLTVMTK